MNTLNLEIINRQAPYKVTQIDGYSHLFYFNTDYEVEYEISIMRNDIFVPSGAYALDIRKKSDQIAPGDPKFKQTLMAIIEEFFRQNNDVILYITETKDEKQAFRNRLFMRWFNTYEHRELYMIKSAEGKMDGVLNFMAIIIRKDNQHLLQASREFDETVSFLFD